VGRELQQAPVKTNSLEQRVMYRVWVTVSHQPRGWLGN